MTRREAGKLGGLKTASTHGIAHMQTIGRRGAAVTWERYTLKPVDIAGWAMVERASGRVKALINYSGFTPTATQAQEQ